jgi:hypothetical protein
VQHAHYQQYLLALPVLQGPSVGGRLAMLAVPLLVCLYLPMYYGIDAILKTLYLLSVIAIFGKCAEQKVGRSWQWSSTRRC